VYTTKSHPTNMNWERERVSQSDMLPFEDKLLPSTEVNWDLNWHLS